MINEKTSIAIQRFEGSKYYQNFFKCLGNRDKFQIDLEATALSEALYFHLFKIQLSGWQYMIDSNRAKRHGLSEITQDLIAFYLNAALPDDYSVVLEASVPKSKRFDNSKRISVDIGIKKDDKYHFMIEIKTNIGYQRNAIIPAENTNKCEFEIRRERIAESFGLDSENVVYVFLSHGNVSSEFSANYWDYKNDRAVSERPDSLPLNFIFPLFHEYDPFYFGYKRNGKMAHKNYDKTQSSIPLFDDQEILELAKKNIITPLEHIIKKITDDKSSH